MQALAIMYHDVVENGDFESSGFPGEGAHVYKLRRQDFERHLEAIAGATTAVGTVSQLDGRPVLLTFDDGGSSFHHPIADLLEGRGWRGHFFITTDRIGSPGFLTEAQLRELHRRGHIIGSHSCSHPTRMAALSRMCRGSWAPALLIEAIASAVTTWAPGRPVEVVALAVPTRASS